MTDLIALTATKAIELLRKREITPLDLIDAAADRIAQIEPDINALPTLCLDRARDHAKKMMTDSNADRAEEPGTLAGLPVAIKDLNDVASVRTTSQPTSQHLQHSTSLERCISITRMTCSTFVRCGSS